MILTDHKLAIHFAELMDQNKYYEAGQLMHAECRYIYQGKTIEGVEKIVQTYVSNFDSIKNKLDEIQFLSEVAAKDVNGLFRLKYLDRIRKGTSWFEHRCEQTIRISEGKIIEIEHFDLPGEAEKLKKWFSSMGIKR
jgi:hypothetical protein